MKQRKLIDVCNNSVKLVRHCTAKKMISHEKIRMAAFQVIHLNDVPFRSDSIYTSSDIVSEAHFFKKLFMNNTITSRLDVMRKIDVLLKIS